MSNTRMLMSSLILGVAIFGCAAESSAPAPAPTPTDDQTTDETPPATPDETPSDSPDGMPTEPTEVVITPTAATCTTGGLMCCNVVASASTPLITNLLALLGIRASLLTEPVGVSCQAVASPAACSRVPACCSSSVANLIALGCNQQ